MRQGLMSDKAIDRFSLFVVTGASLYFGVHLLWWWVRG